MAVGSELATFQVNVVVVVVTQAGGRVGLTRGVGGDTKDLQAGPGCPGLAEVSRWSSPEGS